MTRIETVPQAVDTFEHLFDDVLGWERPDWLAAAREQWCGDLPPVTAAVAIAIWRDPWMVVGRDTFTGDLVRRLGWHNVYADAADRYPRVPLEDLDGAGADVVLLPDEPYVFSADDGPEAFSRTPTRLVSGRLLTWYGPSLVEAVPGGSADPERPVVDGEEVVVERLDHDPRLAAPEVGKCTLALPSLAGDGQGPPGLPTVR